MQTYALNLTNGAARSFSTAGDLFVYESGQVDGQEDGDARIIVKPDSGGEITLRAGQQFRLPKGEMASQWFVRPAVDGAPVVGSIIIGAGEFHDANTLNTFKLDGTFTNAVKVTNTEQEPVPVSLVGGDTVTYTHSFADSSKAANEVKTVVAPAANLNGLIVEFAQLAISTLSSTALQGASIVVKSGAPPVAMNDGAVLLRLAYVVAYGAAGNVQFTMQKEKMDKRVKVPPGHGLYVVNGGETLSCEKNILYTLL